ncbi:hypothetical protein PQ455_12030 [Sphingomonas naphthae]|uniref:DUF1440 domain-containing protein n=1 Tax=Sphingomonas naphthae TaxID=1813468 RepID=A0ABY7TGS8_9SPHN|nr:hypothetical protein [Sphingomonas naphthae]WCT72365.1 hypothetical protein PQ455_12030 [Sphingomonas naphthae]
MTTAKPRFSSGDPRRRYAPEKRMAVRVGIGVAFLLWIVSLTYPNIATCPGAGYFDPHPPRLNPLGDDTVSVMGWMGIFVGQLAWYANILSAVLTWGLWKGLRPTRLILIAQPILTLWAFAPIDLWHGESRAEPVCLAGFGPGFYLWMASQIAIALVALYARRGVVATG